MTEAKSTILERLISKGDISFKELLVLIETEKEYIYYQQQYISPSPSYPVIPYPFYTTCDTKFISTTDN